MGCRRWDVSIPEGADPNGRAELSHRVSRKGSDLTFGMFLGFCVPWTGVYLWKEALSMATEDKWTQHGSQGPRSIVCLVCEGCLQTLILLSMDSCLFEGNILVISEIWNF